MVTLCGRPYNIDGQNPFSSVSLKWTNILHNFDFRQINSKPKKRRGSALYLSPDANLSILVHFIFDSFVLPPLSYWYLMQSHLAILVHIIFYRFIPYPFTTGSRRDWFLCAGILTFGSQFDQLLGLFYNIIYIVPCLMK